MSVPKPRDCSCKLSDHLTLEEQDALKEIVQQHLDEHDHVFEYHEHMEVYADPADSVEAIANEAEHYVASMHQQLTMTKHLLAVKRKLEE